MKKLNQIRQGDILLVEVERIPPANIEPKSEVILAKGEITGHAHRVKGEILDWNEKDQRYIHVTGNEPGELFHEDHDPIPAAVLSPGVTYRVIPQQEWNLQDQWNKVVD